MGAIERLAALLQVLKHSHEMILNVAQIEERVVLEPVSGALCENLDNVSFGFEEAEHVGHLAAAAADPPQHVGLVRLAQHENEIVDGVDFKLHRLHVGDELVHHIIQQRIHDPIARDVKQAAQGIDASKHVANVRDWLAVDAENKVAKDEQVEIDGFLLLLLLAGELRSLVHWHDDSRIASVLAKGKVANVAGAHAEKQVAFKDFALFAIVAHQNVFDGQGMHVEDLSRGMSMRGEFRRRQQPRNLPLQ